VTAVQQIAMRRPTSSVAHRPQVKEAVQWLLAIPIEDGLAHRAIERRLAIEQFLDSLHQLDEQQQVRFAGNQIGEPVSHQLALLFVVARGEIDGQDEEGLVWARQVLRIRSAAQDTRQALGQLYFGHLRAEVLKRREARLDGEVQRGRGIDGVVRGANKTEAAQLVNRRDGGDGSGRLLHGLIFHRLLLQRFLVLNCSWKRENITLKFS